MLISGIFFIASLLPDAQSRQAKVRDVFAHVNHGISDNPNEAPSPFVQLYTVEEIKDGKARVRVKSMHMDGTLKEYETWDSAETLGRFDTKMN